MLTAADFQRCVDRLGQQARDDIAWSQALMPPTDADEFAAEIIFVVCNSGMKNTMARKIFDAVMLKLAAGESALSAFGHIGKADSINRIWHDRQKLLAGYLEAADKLAFLESLPWIGPITKYHAAKNFGFDVAKPDVHLQRLADREGCTVQQLCERLAAEVGLRIATVDTVLWRACANGVLDSRTGVIA